MWFCTGPIEYDTHLARSGDIAQPQVGARGPGRGRCVPAGGGAGERVLAPQRALRQRGGLRLGLADALHEEYKAIVDAGLLLQVDDAVLVHEADSIMSLGGSLGRLPQVGGAARRRAEPRAAGPPGGPRPVPHLLGQLPRPARATTRRSKDIVDLVLQGQRGHVRDRAVERPPRARVARLGGREAAGGQEAHPRRRQPPHERRRAPGARRPAAGPARERRRARERDRRHRLRLRAGGLRAARPPRDPVGEARRAGRGRAARDLAGALGATRRRSRQSAPTRARRW